MQPAITSTDGAAPAGEQAGGAFPIPSGLVNSATGAAGTLAGWAISSLGKRVCGNLPQ
jgi:SCY1-like protein 1